MAPSLSEFLREQKEAFLAASSAGKEGEWTIVMGNEAGDLDSQACSIAYAYLTHLAATSDADRAILPLSRTARPDLHLRPENERAFSLSSLSPSDLFCSDDLPLSALSPEGKTWKVVLVDHNRLSPEFSSGSQDEDERRVRAVVDHHDDEHLYPHANPRIIRPPTEAGSCSSLVTNYLRPIWEPRKDEVPRGVAILLLSAILIDTAALKPNGKARQVDREAAAFLFPLCGFPAPSAGAVSLASGKGEQPIPEEAKDLATDLITRKFDVSHLGTLDLLRRDYKEYTISPPSSSHTTTASDSQPASQADQPNKTLRVGLATVPLSLKAWKEKDPHVWEGMDTFLTSRSLDALGVLTTYRTENKGKHRRQICLLFPPSSPASASKGGLQERLYAALEGSQVLALEREEEKERRWGFPAQRGRIWMQGNADATRKQVAPVVVGCCEAFLGGQ